LNRIAGPADHLRMIGSRKRLWIPLLLASGLALGPAPARANDPHFTQAPPTPAEQPLRIVEPEPEPPPNEGDALRMTPEQPDMGITLADPPAPILEPTPTPIVQPRRADRRRPIPGTGLIVVGATGLILSASLVLTAIAGPGWIGMDRSDAAIVGALAFPAGLASTGVLIGGISAERKYRKWSERNQLHPPHSGNGKIVIGGLVTAVGITGMVAGGQALATDPTIGRGAWAGVGVAGGLTAAGLAVLSGGMIARSKFANWERTGYLQPGTMALHRGVGLSLSGRF
jgi:hypothetical protein